MIVDDTHWLDLSTGHVLAFIARRLESDPMVIVACGRHSDADPLADADLPELHLSPLDPAASSTLLDAGAPDLGPQRRRRVLESAAGNPLALVELPKALHAGRVGDLSERLPMTARLERAFAVRASELQAPTRDLLLVAACNDSDSLAETLAAARRLSGGADLAGLEVAAAAGLVELDGEAIRFRHPLVRSALSHAASLTARHAAHAALAEVLAADPDRAVWHRAACVLDCDDGVATELEESALRSERRGGVDSAITALQRSAQLTTKPAARGRRLLGAAELASELGRSDLSGRLVRSAQALELEPHDRLRLAWVEEASDRVMSGGAERVQALIRLAEQAREARDADLALHFLRVAALRCWTATSATGGHAVIAATSRLAVDELDPRRIVIGAYAAPFSSAAETIELLDRRAQDVTSDPSDLHLLGHAAACVGAFPRAERLLDASAQGLREQGRLVQLAQALRLGAWTAWRLGRWDAALAAAEECARLARETRQPAVQADALSTQAMIVGIRGDEHAAKRLAAAAEALALAGRSVVTLATIQNGRAMTAAGADRPAEAFALMHRIFLPSDPLHHRPQAMWALGSLVEHATRSGHDDEARAELSQAETLGALTPAAGVHVALRYARALLAEPAGAEQLWLAALDVSLGDWPFDHARAQLGYGEWLRRDKRVTDARGPLRAALSTFERLGAQGYAERARRELRAAGEHSARRAPEAWDQLSAQETQIAEMVAQGLSNKEIGQRLYLSHRTVASHLYRMFPKLGITSRAQVAHAISERQLARRALTPGPAVRGRRGRGGRQAGTVWLTGVPTPRAIGSPGYSYQRPGWSVSNAVADAEALELVADRAQGLASRSSRSRRRWGRRRPCRAVPGRSARGHGARPRCPSPRRTGARRSPRPRGRRRSHRAGTG